MGVGDSIAKSPGEAWRSRGAVVALWAALAAACLVAAAPRVEVPGLYYDEAFLAQQARDFLEPERPAPHAGSVRTTEIFGRPFPLRNAVYLGSLKSQLLIPSFALFGATPAVLRLTTLSGSLLALLLAMLWAERAFGAPVALVAGGLLASDPTWLFYSLHEWGPFTTGLLCRSGALLAVTVGWQTRRSGLLAAGGLLAGLGVYSRADFAVVAAGLAVAFALAYPALAAEALRERRRGLLAAGIAGAVGASPMLLSLRELLQTSLAPQLASRGGLAEKLRVLWSTLDGSRFYELMAAGGRFERAFQHEGPETGLGLAVLGALALGGARTLRDAAARQRGVPGALRADARFPLLGALIATAATVALPGAVRAHHLLNAMPLFHVGVAAVGVDLWRRADGRRLGTRLLRGALALAFAAVLLSQIAGVRATYALLERTGGQGWWSDAIYALAADLEGAPTTRAVSLDWGLHEPLLFLTEDLALQQPLWRIRPAVRREGRWRWRGRGGEVYLLHPRRYDLFGYGPAFLAEARRAAERAPERVRIRRYEDRTGEPALVSVRLDAPHRLVYRGRFELRWLAPSGSPSR